jgi:glycosyltransferase involved in cell wall biosynthesis
VWRHVNNPEETETALKREGIQRLATGHRWRWLHPRRVKCSDDGLAWLIGGSCRRILKYLSLDSTMGWIQPAERVCSNLTMNDVDVVLASGPGFAAFPFAQRLAERLRCPYVLDYRDLWCRHLYNPAPLAVRKEASVLAGSSAVTIVSPSWGMVLDQQFRVGHKLHIVSNGYDSEELAKIEPHDFGHFAIVYAGSLWPPKRVVSPVMAALRRLDRSAATHGKWKFHYYGKHSRHVWEEAERFGVTERVIVNEQVPRSTALAAVKGAGVSVVITSVGENDQAEDNGMVTGKIFEGIGLGTPTLLIAPAGSDANAVAETAGLVRSFTADNLDGIVSFLGALMSGKSLEPRDPAAYSWENIVGRLDTILRKVVGA